MCASLSISACRCTGPCRFRINHLYECLWECTWASEDICPHAETDSTAYQSLWIRKIEKRERESSNLQTSHTACFLKDVLQCAVAVCTSTACSSWRILGVKTGCLRFFGTVVSTQALDLQLILSAHRAKHLGR